MNLIKYDQAFSFLQFYTVNILQHHKKRIQIIIELHKIAFYILRCPGKIYQKKTLILVLCKFLHNGRFTNSSGALYHQRLTPFTFLPFQKLFIDLPLENQCNILLTADFSLILPPFTQKAQYKSRTIFGIYAVSYQPNHWCMRIIKQLNTPAGTVPGRCFSSPAYKAWSYHQTEEHLLQNHRSHHADT